MIRGRGLQSRVLAVMLDVVLEGEDDMLGILGGQVDREGVLHMLLPGLLAIVVARFRVRTLEPGRTGLGLTWVHGGGVVERHYVWLLSAAGLSVWYVTMVFRC